MRKSQSVHIVNRVALYVLLTIASVLFITPLVWMFSTSIKPGSQVLVDDSGLLPTVPTGEELARDPYVDRDDDGNPIVPGRLAYTGKVMARNYSDAWNNKVVNFPRALKNSLIVCTLSVIGMVLSSSVVAFGFSRLEWRGRGVLFSIVIATMLIPYPVLMGSLYIIFKNIGWIGSFKPLWVPMWFGGAFQIFLLRQFFLTIPRELDEAARIDGCSQIGVFWRIILPLSRPALAVVALFTFIYAWNDFLAPLIYLNHQDQFTIALGLQMFQSQQGNTPWNQLMAATTLVTLPVLVLFIMTQRTFVEGIAMQGLKG